MDVMEPVGPEPRPKTQWVYTWGWIQTGLSSIKPKKKAHEGGPLWAFGRKCADLNQSVCPV